MLRIEAKQDRMLEKQDQMLEKQDETVEELRGVRSDLREHMDRRFARMEEIAEIKRAIRELGGCCVWTCPNNISTSWRSYSKT